MKSEEAKRFMKRTIENMKPGTEFVFSDIMPEAQSVLGRTLLNGVKDGTISDVECLGVVDGVDRYRKK